MSAERKTKPKTPKAPKPAPFDPMAGLPPGAVDLDALPTPPLVLEMLERLKPKKKARGYWEDEYKLSYYYGGKYVVADFTGGRFIVIAAVDEIGPPGELADVIARVPDRDKRRIVNLIPEWIDTHIHDLPRKPRPKPG